MGKQLSPHGNRFRPLSRSEFKQYDEPARDSSDGLTELAARTLLHTGLRTDEFSQLRGNWLASIAGGDYGVLRVHAKEECLGSAGAVGRSTSVDANSQERNAACYTCRNARDGYWESEPQDAVREIPITKKGVCELLADWFETHEQIPLLHGAVATRVKHVGEWAGFSRQVQQDVLLQTHVTMLTRKGVEPHTIAAVLGLRLSDTQLVCLFREATREFEKTWEPGEDSEADNN